MFLSKHESENGYLNLTTCSDDQLMTGLGREFEIERNVSHHILLYLKEIKARRAYAKRGFPNLFWMLVRHFRQSESAANQRLKALELMLAVPLVEDRLVSGELNLGTVAMAQRQILREEKLSGSKMTSEKKMEIVESITGKTLAETETELFKHLPKTASEPQNHEQRISETVTRMNLNVPDDVRNMMIRLKELWAHVDPSMDHVEVMRRAFKIALEKDDPTLRKAKSTKKLKSSIAPQSDVQMIDLKTQSLTESAKRCGADASSMEAVRTRSSQKISKRLTYYGKEFDRQLWERAQSRCEFVDSTSGRRCECTFRLQREHVIPLARGGANEISNMQLLCATHNQLRARFVFGNKKINAHQESNRKLQ